MRKSPLTTRSVAFTLIELLFVIGVVAVLAAFLFPKYVAEKQKSQRIHCTSRMKQINFSFRIWASDHTDLNPMQVSMEFGGTKEHIATGETFRHFEVMSNELNTPFILACPSDTARTPLRSFDTPLNNSNVSYFVGIDADQLHPGAIMAGDRNILGGKLVGTNLLDVLNTNGIAWGSDLHNGQGNVGMADGSAQGFSSAALRTALMNTGLETNRLAMP